MRTLKKVLALTALAVAIQGCGETGPKLEKPPVVTDAVAILNPVLGGDGLPFPTDLMFNETTDGSLNIPGANENPAFAAMNTLGGFATTAPMVIRFSGPVDNPANADDVKDGILVFETDATSPAMPVGSIVKPLIFGVDYAAGISGGVSALVIPLKPLKPSTTHLIVVTSDLETRAGNPVGADSVYALGKGAFSLKASGALGAAIPNFAVAADGTSACDFTNQASLPTCQLNPAYTDLAAMDVDDPANSALVPAILGARQIVGGVQPLFDDAAAALAASDLPAFGAAMKSIGTLDTLRGQAAQDLTALAAATPQIDPAKVVLSYRVTTQNIGAAQQQAVGQVAASTPSLAMLNPLSDWTAHPQRAVVSPGADGNPQTGDDHSAHIYLATLNGTLQFVDPNNANTSHWEADVADWLAIPQCSGLVPSEKLLGCNQFKPTAKLPAHSMPVLISAPRIESLNPAHPDHGNFPDCSAGNLPVVIFQHGITSNRGSMMALADTLAKACMVGVAIDLPKHGISPADTTFAALGGLHAALTGGMVFERLVKVSSPMTECQAGVGEPVESEFYCPSGDNFVNLADLANARDTLRQAAVDLSSLTKALVDDAGGALKPASIGTTIDPNNIHFVGMSLGGIVGGVFAANEPALKTVTLNVAGGGIAKILDGSPSFEPEITAGLYQAAGLFKPSGDYEGFLIMAQTLMDSVDPINYASTIVTNDTPVMMQEVIGDPSASLGACVVDGDACPDQVVPNNVYGSTFGGAWGLVGQTGQTSFLAKQNFITTPVALAGTDPLAQGTGFIAIASAVQQGLVAALGIGPVAVDPATLPATAITFKGLNLKTVTDCGATGGGIVRYTNGTHSSLLSPAGPEGSTQYLAVTGAMQTHVAGFIGTGGAVIPANTHGVVFSPTQTNASHASCAP